MTQKALLVISFGVSHADTRRKTIEAAERDLSEAFPDYDLKRAFTSHIVIHKLRKRDHLLIDTVSQAAGKMLAEGYTEVLAQPLHILNGVEYHQFLADLRPYASKFARMSIGRPLLTDLSDYRSVAYALGPELPKCSAGEAVLLMGHGSQHPANAAYCQLDYVLKDEGLSHVHLATLQGYPTLETVIKRLEANHIRKIILLPFMLVAGDHVLNDMAGDEPDSWKSILQEKGFTVETRLVGLGEIEKIRQIYVEHARAALERAVQ
jgi:sirohydrochlorin cobaltochelatase